MSRPSWCKFTTAIWCDMQNVHHHADYSSAQWAVTTLVRYATRTVLLSYLSSVILRVRRAPRQSLRSVPTDILHNTVMVCLQQLALLAPTLRPTRWQQSVSTARRRRRRRNFRRVGWAVAWRCERQRRGSQHAATAVCRTHQCAKSRRAHVCIQSYTGIVWGNWSNSVIDSIDT